MSEEYNKDLCDERHSTIEKALGWLDQRVKKVENRFLAIMTILVMNLAGVVGTLVVLLLRSQGV